LIGNYDIEMKTDPFIYAKHVTLNEEEKAAKK
jgi:hypothetical protein